MREATDRARWMPAIAAATVCCASLVAAWAILISRGELNSSARASRLGVLAVASIAWLMAVAYALTGPIGKPGRRSVVLAISLAVFAFVGLVMAGP